MAVPSLSAFKNTKIRHGQDTLVVESGQVNGLGTYIMWFSTKDGQNVIHILSIVAQVSPGTPYYAAAVTATLTPGTGNPDLGLR